MKSNLSCFIPSFSFVSRSQCRNRDGCGWTGGNNNGRCRNVRYYDESADFSSVENEYDFDESADFSSEDEYDYDESADSSSEDEYDME